MGSTNGCAAFQWIEFPRMAPEPSKPHHIIKLDTKLLDACVGKYEIAPDNVYRTRTKVTISRNGDHLVWQAFGRFVLQRALDLYPESETNFFLKNHDGIIFKYGGAQVTFIKNDKGEATAVIHHYAGLPDSEGKKLKSE
jgi:hypothetical protein